MPKRALSNGSNGDVDHPSQHQRGTGTEGKHAWKKSPPYAVHKDNFDVKHTGSCHCGRVQFQLSRDAPLNAKLCHCTTCQKQHASPNQWAAIFHKEDINFVNGVHELEWYDPSEKSVEHKLPCKVRCNFCHSPIMDEGRSMILLFPTLIDFKDDAARDKFRAKMHIFYSQRVLDIPDGLPKWSKIDKESDLIEDSPAEMVEELKKERREKKDGGEKENGGEKKNGGE